MTAGIFYGLLAALFQSGGYLFSRLFVKAGGTPLQLLVRTQLLMGAAGAAMLPAVWPAHWPAGGAAAWIGPLAAVAFGSLGGQYFFFRAEQNIAPSRLASLIGLRVVVLAAVSAGLGLERYTAAQTAGIALAVVSAAVMNYTPGGGFAWPGTGSLAACLGCYAVSDLNVRHLLLTLNPESLPAAAMLAMALVNLLLALVMLPAAPRMKLRARELVPAMPFAGAWLLKQFFLYACYTAIGPVFANVVMAARGPISIALTLLLLHCGVRRLEAPKSGAVWLRRGLATLIMAGAIALYCLG